MPARLLPPLAPRRAAPLRAVTVLALATGLAGCAMQRYEPRPLDPAAAQQAWLSARTDDDALRESLARQGIDTQRWPLPAWDREALTALAITRHPDLAVAQAELRSAEAAAGSARARQGLGIETTIEHHGGSDSPWTLGVVLDALLTGGERRAAQADAADALALAAVHQAAQTAWQVRQRVHAAWQERAQARQRALLAARVLALQQSQAASQEARLARGATDRRDVLQARQAELDATREALQAEAGQARAELALAAAAGLAPETLAALPLAPADDELDAPLPSADALQRTALQNRLDLRSALARYAAAEATLRLEIARQWPELVLKPGYAWDQGENRWSLGLALSLPPGGRNQAAIAQAEAQRELEGRRCLALQAESIARLAQARQAAATAQRLSLAAQDRASLAADRQARTARRLAAGDADRPELLAAELAALEAQRDVLDARSARHAAAAALEDALQQPLDARAGAPRTAIASPPNLATSLAR